MSNYKYDYSYSFYNSSGRTFQVNSEFKSFKEVYHTAMDELDEIESEEQHDLFLSKYKDILTIIDSTYVPKIISPFYQVICNRDGIYESEGYAHKIIDSKHIVITNSENINELQEVHSVSGLDPEVFRVASYNGNDSDLDQGRMNANCGTTLIKDYFNNHTKCKDDRRVYVRAHTSYAISGYDYTPLAISETFGHIRNWLCNWKKYRTTLETRNSSFTVSATLNGNTYNYPMTFSDQWDDDVYEIILHQGAVAQPIYWQGGYTPSIQFTQVHLEGTSRGVGNNWVILDCQ